MLSVEDYLSKVIAAQLSQELEPILNVKEVTRNSVLLGSYAEAALRRLCRRALQPLRVSTGAIIDHPLPDVLRQIDIILWAPFPAPSVFEIEDFGLVPRSSAFGAIEIKRSNYTGVDKELEDFVALGPKLIAESEDLGNCLRVLGVICVLEEHPSARLEAMLTAGTAIALFDKTSSEVQLRAKDVLRLINFLHYVSRVYHRHATLSPFYELRTNFE